MKRRDLLQGVGWIAATLGLSEVGLMRLGDRYSQAIAQPTSRKLALLVGINQYPQQTLTGCLTDVELQRELLVHRFGFQNSDILILTDQQATRQNILEAFIDHLLKPAKADDVVVFHFSGYGRCLTSSSPAVTGYNTLMPVDADGQNPESLGYQDLGVETLKDLLRSLPTNRVTAILDTGYRDQTRSLRGNLRLRARPSRMQELVNLEIPEALRAQLQAVKQSYRTRSQLPVAILAAAQSSPVDPGNGTQAFETQWSGFSAGLFTYALTQYLWSATPATPLQTSFYRSLGTVEQLAGIQQQPQLSGPNRPIATYYLAPVGESGADGAIAALEDDGKTAQLWLAGIPSSVIEYYGVNSLLTVQSPEPLTLQVFKRDGLTAKARLKTPDVAPTPLQVGQLVTEAVRVIPRNVPLTVGLSAELERIERVDATSAFAGIPLISAVGVGETTQSLDCVFAKIPDPAKAGTSGTPATSYGLLVQGCHPIPSTVGETGEAIKTAVRRLGPQLQALRSAKLLRLTNNGNSSRLAVKAALELVAPQTRLLGVRESHRSGEIAPNQGLEPVAEELTLPVGSRIRYRLENRESYPVYVLLFGLNHFGSSISISKPANVSISPIQSVPDRKSANSATRLEERSRLADPEAAISSNLKLPEAIAKSHYVIAPSETLYVPQMVASVEWAVCGPTGLAETQLIFSAAPFIHTLEVLSLVQSSSSDPNPSGGILANPLEVAQAVLQDLHQASGQTAQAVGSITDADVLDTKVWASLNFVYRIV